MLKPLLTSSIAVLFLTACIPVFGQATHGFQFTWIDPVERTDGEPLAPEELWGYRMYCVGNEEVEVVVPRHTTEQENGERSYFWQDAVQRGGWYDCQMTAIDENELESDWSNIASVRKLAIPQPPRNIRGR